MIDELELVRQVRPEVQLPGGEAKEAARRALDRAIAGSPGRSGSRRWLGGLGRVVPALGVVIAVVVAVLFLSLRGHSPATTGGSKTLPGSTAPTVSTPPSGSTTGAAPPPQEQTPLTGTWTGQSSGAYNGTLTIIWQQSGWKEISPGVFHSKVNGSIQLSSLPGTLSVRGTVLTRCGTPPCNIPDVIKFRTVSGRARITYVGSVGYHGISGTYRTATGRGSWSASQLGP